MVRERQGDREREGENRQHLDLLTLCMYLLLSYHKTKHNIYTLDPPSPLASHREASAFIGVKFCHNSNVVALLKQYGWAKRFFFFLFYEIKQRFPF